MLIKSTRTHAADETWTFRKIAQAMGVAILAFTQPTAAVVATRSARLYGPRHRTHRELTPDIDKDLFRAKKVETHAVSKSLEALWLPFESPQPSRVQVRGASVGKSQEFKGQLDVLNPLVVQDAVVQGVADYEIIAAPPPPLPQRNSSLLWEPAPILQCIEGGSLRPCPSPIIPEPVLQSYLAMCVIVRDEPFDLPEWINHYRELGAGAFYIFDHNSSIPLRDALEETNSTSDINYRYFNDFIGNASTQVTVYNTCIRDYGDRHQFIGFLDSDEYLIPKKGPKQFTDFLRRYEHSGSLAINWRQFGSSGHIRRPEGRVVDNYVNCWAADDVNNKHVKLFGNTQYIDRMEGPHTALYTHQRFAVDENMLRVDGPFSETISMQKYVLHHYVTRSLEDFERKMARGAAHGCVPKTMDFFHGVNQQATSLCLAGRTKAADDV